MRIFCCSNKSLIFLPAMLERVSIRDADFLLFEHRALGRIAQICRRVSIRDADFLLFEHQF